MMLIRLINQRRPHPRRPPCILSYGFLALRNYKMVSNTDRTDLGDDNCPSFGYIIMNAMPTSSLCPVTLEKFLEENHKDFTGQDLADLTFNIAE